MSALIEESAAVPTMEVFEKVTVNVKAIAVKDPTQIGDKTKQDILIADKTGTAKVSLWEDHVNALIEHDSYCLKNFMVREYQ